MSELETAEQLLKESILSDLDQAILLGRNRGSDEIVNILIGVETEIKWLVKKS